MHGVSKKQKIEQYYKEMEESDNQESDQDLSMFCSSKNIWKNSREEQVCVTQI